jgi:3-hydroxybutyryl-CoA dehydrogenase
MSRVKETTLAVIGAGTMGRGIALTALRHGYDVAIFDVDHQAVLRFSDAAADPGRDGQSHGKSAATSACGSVIIAESISTAVEQSDAAIESVVESEQVKTAVLAEMAAAATADTLLATNTSTFSIARLAAASGCNNRLLGMHFFNPADKMRLVEVAVAADTPDSYVRRCTDLARGLGKTAVVVNDTPGFITSRLGLALGNEAMRMVASGVATPTAIDTAMRLGYNHPMGPLELADLVGLDARLNNLNALYPALADDHYRPPQILVNLVSNGYLGRKNGRGFYLYDAGGNKVDALPTVPTTSGGTQ